MHWCFTCIYIAVWGCLIPWNWSYRQLWAAKTKLTIIDEEEMWWPYLESGFAPEPVPGTTATTWSRHGPEEKGQSYRCSTQVLLSKYFTSPSTLQGSAERERFWARYEGLAEGQSSNPMTCGEQLKLPAGEQCLPHAHRKASHSDPILPRQTRAYMKPSTCFSIFGSVL